MRLQALKHFCSEPPVYGLNIPATDYAASGVRLLRTTDIGADGAVISDAPGVYVAPNEAPRKLMLRNGDILLSRSGTLGRSLLYDDKLGPATHAGYLVRFRLSADNHPPYVAYSVQSSFLQDAVRADAVESTIGNFNAEKYANVKLPWWPPPRQRAIAKYLDRETKRIGALIEAKLKIVDRLQERFRASIFDAITGRSTGEDLKPSGLGWVESIPDSWTTPPVAANFEVHLGKMLSPAASAGADHRPYLRNVNVQWDRFDLDDVATMHFNRIDRMTYSLEEGDLLVCEGGEVGRAAIWRGELPECYFQKALHRLRPIGGANPRYLLYCLRGAADHGVFAVEGNLSTIVHLTREQLMVHRFPWPPAEEQAGIVARLDELGRGVTATVGRVDRQIELLRERRQALITAAIGGQVDIPEAA